MLHAINARKARLERVIDGVGKQPREDLITSALFGTIQFLSPPARRLALQALLGGELGGDAEIYLWPYLKHSGENAEPDVVLRVNTDKGLGYWIVEVKWGAPLGDEQIGREIRTLGDGECRRGGMPFERNRNVVGYTLLGAEPKHAASMQTAQEQFNDLIHSETWRKVTERLRKLASQSNDDPGLKAWAGTAEDFLRGTPKGSVLDQWSDLIMPAGSEFTFAASRQFNFKNTVGSIPAAHFNFF